MADAGMCIGQVRLEMLLNIARAVNQNPSSNHFTHKNTRRRRGKERERQKDRQTDRNKTMRRKVLN